MKFFAIAALIAATQAEQVCVDEGAPEKLCPDGACCGYLQPAAGAARRACSGVDDQATADGYEGADVFTCDPPAPAEEEGASKIVLGASALLATLYMA